MNFLLKNSRTSFVFYNNMFIKLLIIIKFAIYQRFINVIHVIHHFFLIFNFDLLFLRIFVRFFFVV